MAYDNLRPAVTRILVGGERDADAALRGARVALPAGAVLLPARRRPRQRRRRGARQGDPAAGAGADSERPDPRRDQRGAAGAARCASATRAGTATDETIGARFAEEQRALRPLDVAVCGRGRDRRVDHAPRPGARRTAPTTRCRVAWAGLDLTGVGGRDDGHRGRPGRHADHASAATVRRAVDRLSPLSAGARAASRRRCGRCCPSCCAIWGRRFPRCGRGSPRSTGRGRPRGICARILGQLETRGDAVVVPALETALSAGHAAAAGAHARDRAPIGLAARGRAGGAARPRDRQRHGRRLRRVAAGRCRMTTTPPA